MSDSVTYSVVLSGNLKPGFETKQVIAAFAKLFVVPFDQATRVVGTEYVVRKDVTLEQAEVYRARLDGIGLEVKLQRHDDIDGLSLAPIADRADDEAAAADRPRPLPDGHMRCPACHLEQPEAEQCSGCGVYMRKVMPPPPGDHEDGEMLMTQRIVGEESEDAAAEAAANELKMFVAPAIVAVVGAILWYLIAVMLGMEFGGVALAIGLAVSYAANRAGANGVATGIACAVLVVLSICAGKYLYLADLRFDFGETVSSVTQFEEAQLYQIYDKEIEDARQFASLPADDVSLMKFMVVRKYSDSPSADEVPFGEVRNFRESVQPRLEKIFAARPGFEQWREFYFDSGIRDTSTFGLMVASIGGLDMMFLVLGVVSAFLLAYRGTKSKNI